MDRMKQIAASCITLAGLTLVAAALWTDAGSRRYAADLAFEEAGIRARADSLAHDRRCGELQARQRKPMKGPR